MNKNEKYVYIVKVRHTYNYWRRRRDCKYIFYDRNDTKLFLTTGIPLQTACKAANINRIGVFSRRLSPLASKA